MKIKKMKLKTLTKILVAATVGVSTASAAPPCPEGPNKIWCEHDRKVEQMWRTHDQQVERMWQSHNQQVDRMWQKYDARIRNVWEQQDNIFDSSQTHLNKPKPVRPIPRIRPPHPTELNKPTYQDDIDLLWNSIGMGRNGYNKPINPFVEPSQRPTNRPIVRPQPALRPTYEDIKPVAPTPPPISRLEQLANKNLNRKEFKELRGLINTVEELREYVTLSNLKYQKTPAGNKNLDYGSPLNTHNNKGNSNKEIECDELALYLASLLSDNKDHQVYVVGFGDKRNKEFGHVINLIQTPQKKWIYTSNTDVSKEFATKNEALDAGYQASDLSFAVDRLKVRQRKLTSGKWIYNNKASRKLGP
jgi:hypothetical protein